MKRIRLVRPVCSERRVGLPAVTPSHISVWWCAGDNGHVAASVGESARCCHRPGKSSPRIERQEVLYRDTHVPYSAVIHEAALRESIAPAAVVATTPTVLRAPLRCASPAAATRWAHRRGRPAP